MNCSEEFIESDLRKHALNVKANINVINKSFVFSNELKTNRNTGLGGCKDSE